MPIFTFALSAVVLLFYPLDKLLPMMRAEMEARRAQLACRAD